MSKKSQFGDLPAQARLAVALFGLAGAGGLVRAVLHIGPIDYAYFGLLMFLAVVSGHAKVRLVGGSSLSLITTVALVSMMMLGPAPAIVVGVCGVFVQCAFPPKKFIPHHLVFNVGMIVLTISMASAGYYAVVRGTHTAAADQFIGALVASLLYYLGSSVFVSMIVSLSGKKSIFRIWHDNFLYTAPSFFVAGLLAWVVAHFAASMRATVLLVVVPILYLCYYSYRVYLNSLENEKKHAGEMADLFNSTLSTLALAIDAKDKNTHGHIQRVQKYARAIAEAMKLDEEQVDAIAAAALLHDIGKLAIPEYILSKRGPLTPEEMRKMRMHPQLGADIISNIKFPYPVADSILAHHERFDGLGYPNGLRGPEIPLGARVLAVADVFDAYTSDRVECEETINGAIQSLRDGTGTFFDPDVVKVWESIHREVVTWSSNHTSVYTGIQQATSELKLLESLTHSIEGITAVGEIALAVCSHLTKTIPGCTASLQAGECEGVPVIVGDKTIGTICVERNAIALNEDELRLIHVVAEKIGPALNNALELENARREATVDKLTGLANRRAFEMMSASLGSEYSIVLIDVNGFKGVNDNFGHNAGDAALVRIGIHLRSAFPDAELTCRLGGDEFLVLTYAPATAVRMQIRNFRRMVVWDPPHAPYRKLLFGVSCGLASVPCDAADLEEAMKCADERMYAVKTRFKHFASRAALTAH
ncbi:MAG TPA: HD domain-containing phosphohydrolase [Terriglobia bacterium]|nr:HD domain-containing phosphohydrolase [Terriglobia bacterium]